MCVCVHGIYHGVTTEAAKVQWLDEPEEHDYPAARAFLRLIAPDDVVDVIVDGLRAAAPTTQKAKDILRAARLELLPRHNPHVASDLDKVAHRTALSPILLVRGDIRSGTALTIADGYHRVCASHHLDENMDIPCRIVSLPRGDAR